MKFPANFVSLFVSPVGIQIKHLKHRTGCSSLGASKKTIAMEERELNDTSIGRANPLLRGFCG
jgi:hypothetical protein